MFYSPDLAPKRNRANDRFYNRVFKACLEVAEIADLSYEDTISLTRDLTGTVVEAVRRDLRENPPRVFPSPI